MLADTFAYSLWKTAVQGYLQAEGSLRLVYSLLLPSWLHSWLDQPKLDGNRPIVFIAFSFKTKVIQCHTS